MKRVIIVIGLLVFAGCGKTSRYTASTSSAGTTTTSTTTTSTSETTTTTTSSTTSLAPLSYEFTKLGNETFTTGTITTDNVLKVKFYVSAEQGNSVWKASELKVTIMVNGYEVTPTYTSSNYVYGLVGETSNVMDLSSYITPGASITITVKLPKNDFYCTYYYNNPLYNQYPGCRKEVYKTHNWSGVLTVQTSSTQSI